MKAPLKAPAWWSHKFPPQLAIAYFALASAPHPGGFFGAGLDLALYVIAGIGIAGFGYVVTDAFDVEEDMVLGKPNLWSPLGSGSRAMLIIALLAATWIPLLLIPAKSPVLALVGLQLAMFFLYAMPPVRLKERGLAGILADAMYAHMLPAFWTWVLFSEISGARAPVWFVPVLATWALSVGMRNLLHHQVLQHAADSLANVRTYAVQHGNEATLSTIVRYVLPVEILTFFLLVAVIGFTLPVVAAGFAGYLVLQVIKLRVAWSAKFRLAGPGSDSDRSYVAGTLFLSRFYERWLAPLILAGMAMNEPAYLVLLAIHLLLFRRAVTDIVRDDLPGAISWIGTRLRSGATTT